MTAKQRSIVKVLTDAYNLIDSPKKWTKGSFAKDKNGHVVSIRNKNACSFCLYGAIVRVAGVTEKGRRADTFLEDYYATTQNGPISFINFNDYPRTKWRDVRKLLRGAIKAIKAAGAGL